jgi:hypothetical protein
MENEMTKDLVADIDSLAIETQLDEDDLDAVVGGCNCNGYTANCTGNYVNK